MTLDELQRIYFRYQWAELQRIYFRYQWANGTAMYVAKHGSPDERQAAEKAALDAYETYLRARVAYDQGKGVTAA